MRVHPKNLRAHKHERNSASHLKADHGVVSDSSTLVARVLGARSLEASLIASSTILLVDGALTAPSTRGLPRVGICVEGACATCHVLFYTVI